MLPSGSRPRIRRRRPRCRRAPARSPRAGSAAWRPSTRCAGSRSLRELREVRALAALPGVAALLALLGHVEEQRRVVGELLEAGDPVLRGVEARLQQAKREGGEAAHLATPGNRFALELVARDNGVDESHLQRLLRVVEPAEEPDLLCLAYADGAGQQPGAKAPVEATHP